MDVTSVEAHARYQAGVRFGDRLRIWTRSGDVRGARLRFEYIVERISEPPGVVADGWTGLPARCHPAELVERLAQLEKP